MTGVIGMFLGDTTRVIRTRNDLAEVVRNDSGYLYNDFGGADPKGCPIHSVGCSWVQRMLAVKAGQLTVKKVWAKAMPDLLSWLKQNGKPFSTCSTCKPMCGTSGAARPHQDHKHEPSASAEGVPRSRDGAFHVCGPSDDRRVAEAWSTRRLPFEPKGSMLALRNEIRGAIRRIHAAPGSFCHGVYVSPDESLCDCENVLFYNVDASGGTFAHLAQAGFCFERVVGCPPVAKSPVGFERQHYHRYEAARDGEWKHWRPEARVAALSAAIPVSRFSVGGVWYALRQSREACADSERGDRPAIGRFGLRVGVGNLSLSSTDRLKKLLDGVVAAFHVHDGTELQECGRRLASVLGEDARSIEAALMDGRKALLGARRLLWPWGQGVQWNPADDLCVAATVHALPDSRSSETQIRVELFEVAARADVT